MVKISNQILLIAILFFFIFFNCTERWLLLKKLITCCLSIGKECLRLRVGSISGTAWFCISVFHSGKIKKFKYALYLSNKIWCCHASYGVEVGQQQPLGQLLVGWVTQTISDYFVMRLTFEILLWNRWKFSKLISKS